MAAQSNNFDDFLQEPVMPKKEDFGNPENYTFAFEEFKHKLETYQARVRFRNNSKDLSEEDKQAVEYEKLINAIEQEIGLIDWGYDPGTDEYGHKLPFSASNLANTILQRQEYKIITDRNSEVMYLWIEKNGTYLKFGEQYLKALIDKVLGDLSRFASYQ